MGSEQLIFHPSPVPGRFPISTPRQGRGSTPGAALYLLLETLSTQHPGPVDRLPNRPQLAVGYRFVKEGPIGLLPLPVTLAQ